MVIPMLAGFAVALVFMVNAGIVQVRSMDAAREAARMVARGDSIGEARAVAQRVAATDATIRISKGTHNVRVQVSVPISGPGGLLRGQLGQLTARAESLMEPAANDGLLP
jgi:hypothetical protein